MTRIDAGLLGIIRRVRNRWRARLLLRGLAYTGVAALVLFVALSVVASRSGFTPAAVITLRLVGWGTVLFVAARWLVLPLLRRTTDTQVALYIEEHEPALRSALLSALDTGSGASPALLRRTVEDAVARMHAIDDGRAIEQRELKLAGGLLAGVAVCTLLLVAARPATLRHGADALLNPLTPPAGAPPLAIDVQPGDDTIPRGADATVRAAMRGFRAAGADVLMRTGADSVFARVPMVMTGADSASFEVMLFTLREDAEYFVESGDVRSRVHRITVLDLPYVERLSLEYRFPAYTGLPPQVVEDGGDVAALRGTTVRVTAATTVPVTAGRILFDDGAEAALAAAADGTLQGEFVVQRAGFYHLELDAGGGMLEGSPQYTIDVLDDRAPSVRFTRPGRDTRPTSIDEVFLEAQADDDYGVARVELVYAVNGGAENTVAIYSGGALAQVTASHTLYLEEMELQAGDLISYYARARDNSSGTPHTVTSDIYFLSIRPFGRDYRQAEQSMPGGGGGGEEENGDLTQTQREIIAATFNVERERARMSAGDLRENLNTIALSQERLREQVGALAQRMRARGVTADTTFRRIAEILPQAAEEMARAVERLRAGTPDEALPPEQRALQHLQRAEALYRDVQVAMQQQGGGGGGGSAPNAEDLADLFELELDKLRNQYETVEQGQREQTQQGVDATLERLRELARRQEQEVERQRRAQAQRNAQGGGSGSAQRELAQETEEAARQLERLARETGRSDLQETARRLQQAADAMRRAAAEQRSGASAQGQSALEQLRDARRRLERNSASALEDEAERARRSLERMAQEQERIARDMQSLREQGGAERARTAQELVERKTGMAEELASLEEQLDRMAGQARGQGDAARQLRGAADAIRDGELREMVEWSRNLTQPQAPPELIDEMEQRIAGGIDDVRERLDDARTALGETQAQDQAESAIERARDLARGVESLAEEAARAAADPQTGAGQDEAGSGQVPRTGQQPGGAEQGGAPPGSTPTGGAARGREDGERQLRSALRERIAEAEALRQELRRQGVDPDRLEDVLSAMRDIERSGALDAPGTLARLQRDVVDGAKEVEFALRRALLAEQEDAPRLRGSADVAEGFRRLVEEYYRALGRQN